ncbi:MAG: hypothetical protein U0575_07680 [Phycisphaerales bacterium]
MPSVLPCASRPISPSTVRTSGCTRTSGATSPTLRDAIGIESRDDLETYRRSGGLRLVFVDDELAGLIGAIRHAEPSCAASACASRVMADRFRGGGFATAAL